MRLSIDCLQMGRFISKIRVYSSSNVNASHCVPFDDCRPPDRIERHLDQQAPEDASVDFLLRNGDILFYDTYVFIKHIRTIENSYRKMQVELIRVIYDALFWPVTLIFAIWDHLIIS